jgi:hypothetical protein
MKKDFVIRGQTASEGEEVLEFGGYKEGYAYILTEFQLYQSLGIGATTVELCGSVTAAKTAEDPENPNFNHEGLIAVANFYRSDMPPSVVVNDTFLITQNLILKVVDTHTSATPINWQCRFKAVKMTDAAAAVQNFKQFSIFDG